MSALGTTSTFFLKKKEKFLKRIIFLHTPYLLCYKSYISKNNIIVKSGNHCAQFTIIIENRTRTAKHGIVNSPFVETR